MAATLGIVRGHGGSIRVESQRDEGTRFEVRFPSHRSKAVDPVSPEGDDLQFDGGRILLVDDEPTVRRVGQRMLERLGFQVTECRDGVAALQAVQNAEQPFEAVLLDLTMPLMPGLEVADRIAEIDPELPIILCSGSPPGREHRRPPVVAFLRKPFGLAELRAVLVEAFENRPTPG